MQDLNQAAEDFAEELKKELSAALYPDLPAKIWNYLHSTLRLESLATLGCGLNTFKDILAGKEDLYTISFLLNALQARTAADLSMPLQEYVDFQELVAEVVATWNGIVEPMKVKLLKRIQAQQRISQGVPKGKLVTLPSA